MKTIFKSTWNNKRVIVSTQEHYIPNGFNNDFHVRIKVEDSNLLPSRFSRGMAHKANIDVIKTVGGVSKYVGRLLENAAQQEQARRQKPIKEQLSLF